jgi:ring-1,2-phenylacetyl-CoA epoxidase subunit PaaD
MKMSTDSIYTTDDIRGFLAEVSDPEIPVLNVVEMGIVRKIVLDNGTLIVKITPTYSGCPAMNAIENEIHHKLQEKGISNFEVITDYSEAWTTDWMTDEARLKLKDYGIAPPQHAGEPADILKRQDHHKIIPCPYCDSLDTKLQSQFGSTACKAQYYCNECEEPFEYFKCI